MNAATRDTIVGLTALIGAGGLVAILLLFGELSAFTDRSYRFELVLNTAAGLNRGSPVTLNGVPVGEVQTLTPLTFPEPGVRLGVKVQENVQIPRDASISVLIGLLGDGTLAITANPDIQSPDYIAEGESVRKNATTLLDEVSAILDQRLRGFNDAANSLVALSDKYVDIGERIEDMLTPRTPAEVDAGLGPPNIRSTIARLDSSVAELEKWLSDDQLRGDARDVVARLPDVIEQTSKAVEAWTQTARAIEARSEQLGRGFDEVAGELTRTADSITLTLEDARLITGRIIEGDGAAGMFINNPDLYRSLNDAARRLEAALTEAQLFIQKIESEGVPIDF